MLITIFPLLALVLALWFGRSGRQRYAFATQLAGPILLFLLLCVLLIETLLDPCEPPRTKGECMYGLGMGSFLAATVGFIWVSAAALGWLIGWLLRQNAPPPAAQ
ncbi:MAG: hypothetical protein ABL932_09705 [Terricaulis sp.]